MNPTMQQLTLLRVSVVSFGHSTWALLLQHSKLFMGIDL
jgi:hypothetical protein